ncbi:MAG: helix-turn-helix domain-containing protein [Verrucomicrobiales bacterium]|nr:helix-turn-helix domain-containing protein [Verrucomicrobiales bacterium]
MATTLSNKPGTPSPEDQELLDKLYNVINGRDRPVLLGREGAHIDFPEPVFHLLVEIVRQMRMGKSVSVVFGDDQLTTQAAADHLGVSRPFLVKLLESGEIPFHMCGTHRRVYLNDLLAYEEKRSAERRKHIDQLSDRLMDDGSYDEHADYTGEA